MRIFRDNKITPRGNVLPYEAFRLFSSAESDTILPERMDGIIKIAEEYLEKEITVIPLSAFRKYQEEGLIPPFSTPWADRLNALFNLGIAEAYEKKGRFTEKLCDYIWAILEEASWMLPEHTVHAPYGVTKVPAVVGSKYTHGLELGSIYRAAVLALVYHYNKETLAAVSPIIPKRIEHALHERIVKPYIECDFYWEGDRGSKVNNWCPWNISNVLLITALTERELYIRERVVEKALIHIDNFVSFYKADGGCDEGPTYWGAAAGSLFDCLEMLEEMSGGRIDVYSDPMVRAMGEYIAKFCIAGNNYVNFADSGATCAPDGYHLYRFGQKCGSQLLMDFGRLRCGDGANLHFRHPYRSMRVLMTPKPVTDGIELASRSVYFPDLKVMIERESENAREGFLLAMKGGHNAESHNHNDVGSIIVYRDGEPVLIDAGVGEYTKQTFSPRRYELWFMQSRYHNVAMFDNIGQMQGGRFASKDEVYDPEARSLTAELSGAYPTEAGVKGYQRCARLADGEVIIRDRIELDREREIDLVFLTHREPKIEHGCVLLNHGCRLSVDDDGFDIGIEEFDPVGMNTARMWGADKLWRIHIRKTADRADVTVTVR